MKSVVFIVLACFGLSVGIAGDKKMSGDIGEKAKMKLEKAVKSRTEEEQARDVHRNPAATLEFFQVKPGMTVAEALPGGGWYSKILANYLGGDGRLFGVNYVDDMWARFGFFSEEAIARQIASTGKFPELVAGFTDNGIGVEGFTFGTVPDALQGSADRVLLIRALHNLNRFEEAAGTRSQAMTAIRKLLKDGGMVGVVQHRLPESAPDAGADGSRGYLKESAVKQMFADAGFEFVGSSEINANPKDQPGPADVVWRLPPTLFGTAEDEARKKAMEAIGESDRMTLLFKKK